MIFFIQAKNLNIEVKDKINFYFCNRMTEHYDKEEKKFEEIIYNQCE